MNKQPVSKARTCSHNDDGISGLGAAPHQVGLSANRLEQISPTVQKFIDAEQLAGAVTILTELKRWDGFRCYKQNAPIGLKTEN